MSMYCQCRSYSVLMIASENNFGIASIVVKSVEITSGA
jgi:hypothetical protein